MATNTYYSAFYPPVVGSKGTTKAVVSTGTVGAIQDDITQIREDIDSLGNGGAVDSTPPGQVTGVTIQSVLRESGTVDMSINFTGPSDADLAGYEVEVREGTGPWISFLTAQSPYTLTALKRNTTYSARIRAFDKTGNKSIYSSTVPHTTTRDTTPPGLPTLQALQPSYNSVNVVWTNPADTDLDRILIRLFNAANTQLDSRVVAAAKPGGSVIFTSLTKGTTYKISLEAIDSSDNSSGQTTLASFTTAAGVDVNDFTPGTAPLAYVDSLPSATGYTGPSVVFNRADGQIYRYYNGAFVVASNVDIADGSISTTKLADGVVTARKLNAALGGGNLLRNSGMERRPNDAAPPYGFAVYNNSSNEPVSYEYTAGRTSGNALRINYNINNSTKGIFTANDAVIDNRNLMLPNQTYVVSFYYRGGGSALNTNVKPLLTFNTQPTLVTFIANSQVTSNWQRAVIRLQWGATVDPSIFFYIGGGDQSTAGWWEIDDIMVQEGDYPTVYAPAFLDGEVTTSKIAPGAITNTKITDDAIETRHIATYAITANEIATDAVTARSIVAGAITTAKLDALAVTAEKIAANSISANKLVVASRPISVSGLNLRVNASKTGVLWDAGTITVVQNDGSVSTYAVASGSAGSPCLLMYRPGYPNLDYNNDSNYLPESGFIKLARWNGGSDLVVYAGVSTVLNGDRIVTGSIAADKIVAKSITADQIATGTISADQIASNAITARVLAIGNPDSIIPDSGFYDRRWWVGGGDDARVQTAASSFNNFNRVLEINPAGGIDVSSFFFDAEPGASYKVFVGVDTTEMVGGVFRPILHRPNVSWMSLKSGSSIDPGSQSEDEHVFYPGFSGNREIYFDNAPQEWGRRMQIRITGGWSGKVKFAVRIIRVSDSTLIRDGSITTDKIVVNSLNGDRITAGTLDASKITAGSIMSGNVYVSSAYGNQTLATVSNAAFDPAGRINAGSTTINPGNILISGGTTLSSWRQGGDTTKIAGGEISANTISANKLKIGLRNVVVENIEFSYDRQTGGLLWTGGLIFYENDAGQQTYAIVSGGSAPASFGSGGIRYVYWPKGATYLVTSVDNWDAIQGGDQIMMCTWRGGPNFVANYGGTIIDGDKITTGSIHANRIQVGTITADLLAAGAITADKIQVGSATGARLALTNNLLSVYDSSNNIVARLGIW